MLRLSHLHLHFTFTFIPRDQGGTPAGHGEDEAWSRGWRYCPGFSSARWAGASRRRRRLVQRDVPSSAVSRAAAASSPQRVARATAVGGSSPADDEVGGGGERWRTRPADVYEMTKDPFRTGKRKILESRIVLLTCFERRSTTTR